MKLRSSYKFAKIYFLFYIIDFLIVFNIVNYGSIIIYLICQFVHIKSPQITLPCDLLFDKMMQSDNISDPITFFSHREKTFTHFLFATLDFSLITSTIVSA
jgi:hypothetical protein